MTESMSHERGGCAMPLQRAKVQDHMILQALSRRHSKDLFLTEVKTGRTWDNRELLRLDAVAVKKSWAHPCITAYEVKVSRSDFLRDEKWHGYLDYCHRLYFACPDGVIELDELPPEVGLMIYNPERDTLSVRRKAQYRNVELPAELLYYIALSRMDSDRYPFFSDRRAFLEGWVAEKEHNRELGKHVRTKMACELARVAGDLRTAQKGLETRDEQYKCLNELMGVLHKKIGVSPAFTPDRYGWGLYLERVREALASGVAPQLASTIRELEGKVSILRRLVDSMSADEEVSPS